MFHLEKPEFAESDACAVKQCDDGFMLDVCYRLDYMADLILGKNLRKSEFPSGI